MTNIYSRRYKFLLDKIFVAVFIISLSPLLLLILLFQFLVYGRQVFYYQERTGYGGKTFTIVKFRTMKDLFDDQGFQLPDIYRLTKIGKILRFYSLDEIPNMLNVLRGEMSMVGPRPLPVRFYSILQEEQKKRCSVLPGITGLAQVSGRNNLSLSEKIFIDLKYISQITLLKDLKICVQTFQQMFINSPNRELGNQSIDKFTPKLDDN